MGISPISWQEIEAWARLTGRNPLPWEVKALVRLDDLLLQDHHQREQVKQKPQLQIVSR